MGQLRGQASLFNITVLGTERHASWGAIFTMRGSIPSDIEVSNRSRWVASNSFANGPLISALHGPPSHIARRSVQYRRTFKVGQQIANKSKPVIDSFGRCIRAFQCFKFYKPFAKYLYKRLGNLPFHARIHHFLMP